MLNHKLILIVFIAISAYSCCSKKKSMENTNKLRVCPDEWIDNRMPMVEGKNDPPKEYFIINGSRVEKDQMDMEWMKKNCDLKPQIVY